MARGSRRATQPLSKFENKPTHNTWVWIMAWEDFFGRNAWQWVEEDERIQYALSMMEGSAVTPFAITYRKKMTGEFGFQRSDGYNMGKLQKPDSGKILYSPLSTKGSKRYGKGYVRRRY